MVESDWDDLASSRFSSSITGVHDRTTAWVGKLIIEHPSAALVQTPY